MKKAIKISLCVITAIIMLSCNVFATTWAEESPYFNDYASFAFQRNITSKGSAEALKNCLDKAYKMGLFGGNVPIACVTTPVDNENLIVILCAENLLVEEEIGQIEKSSEYADLTTQNNITYIKSHSADYLTAYWLSKSGDITSLQQSLEQLEVNARSAQILLIKNQNGEWFYDENSELYAQYYNEDTSTNQTLVTLAEKYTNATQTIVYRTEYVLDIPGIITAIPNGAKQIINNAFGFEIFGINVAGLLSVILIVTIVAFVVKWLMSR